MVYWHKNGNTIFKELLEFMREQLSKYDYEETSTPVLQQPCALACERAHRPLQGKHVLFESDSGDMGMKPMNCPSTILIYKSRKWSYRELPFRHSHF